MTKIKFLDSTIVRTYKCTKCGGKSTYEQKISANFKKKCQFCKTNNLVIFETSSSLSVGVDLNQPKTLGTLAEKNRTKLERRGEISKHEAKGMRKDPPWWRKNKKRPDMSILKNPKKYIEKGIS